LRVTFACPSCERWLIANDPLPSEWRCECGQSGSFHAPDPNGSILRRCVVCGNDQLYRQKNFPQWLGLSLLTFACAAFFILQLLYHQGWAWAILLGSAAIDLILYLIVGDVIVCYRCQARHTGLPKQKAYEPFELAIAEKYRQERRRREASRSAS
jgi:hypothetical protein